MDRDNKPFGARPNGRSTNQLVVKEQGRRPLFGSSQNSRDGKDKEDDVAPPNKGRFRARGGSDSVARRTKSETLDRSSSSLASSGGTRIPKPKGASFSNRKPISLKEAFEKAALEEDDDESDRSHVMDGSPSPAPRPWRREEDKKTMRKILNEDHLDTKATNRPFTRDSLASATLAVSPEKNESPRRRNLYGKPRPGLASRDALKNRSLPNGTKPIAVPKDVDDKAQPASDWFDRLDSKDDLTEEGRIPALVPGIEDLPLPTIENGVPRPTDKVQNMSPEKSYAWQVDEDFTAGDLQVSDSPRIRMGNRPFANRLNFDNDGSAVDINSQNRVARPGSHNTKLDGIRSREAKEGNDLVPELPRLPRKIDGIAALEEQVERDIPIPDRHLSRRTNTKLSDIQEREILPLSNRRLATTRLDEIRERNAEARSLSPEETRPQTSRGVRESRSGSDLGGKLPVRPQSAFEMAGERIPDTPVTVYKNRQSKNVDTSEGKKESGETSDDERQNASHDVLRRLARAASSSPAPETESLPPPPPEPEKTSSKDQEVKPRIARRRSSEERRPLRNDTKEPEHSKPSVGFVGLPRTQSSESVKSKASTTHSETDPTDRIEGEMSLFAPADNQSERGSIRAPSPEIDDEDEFDEFDATPKPKRLDPLLMPTPKITGAYVETPATVKVEKKEIKQESDMKFEEPKRPKSFSLVQEKKPDLSWRNRDMDTASDRETDRKTSTTTSSAGVRRRRAQSLPRRKGPLRNSAKLPSVKDDLMELHRSYNIEDSTLDDFEESLKARGSSALLNDLPLKSGMDANEDSFDFDLAMDTKNNTKNNKAKINRLEEAYYSDSDIPNSDRMRRMSKTLQTGLMGLRSVKKGIERLEGQVSLAEQMPVEEKKPLQTPDAVPHTHEHCTTCATHPNLSNTSTITLPIPRLYHRTPTFRFTLLGLLLFLLSTWYAAESTMCHFHCRKPTCRSPPCTWSVSDPTFGTAIPVKLDQWTTNGLGRRLVSSVSQETSDWLADVGDVVYNRDITKVDLSGLTFEQKRQHRRRLKKKGLVKPRVETPEQKAKWDAWHKARMAKEREKEAREMGYRVRDEESVGGDERVWP